MRPGPAVIGRAALLLLAAPQNPGGVLLRPFRVNTKRRQLDTLSSGLTQPQIILITRQGFAHEYALHAPRGHKSNLTVSKHNPPVF